MGMKVSGKMGMGTKSDYGNGIEMEKVMRMGGTGESHARDGKIINCSISYFLSNISAKRNIKTGGNKNVESIASDVSVVFLGHSVQIFRATPRHHRGAAVVTS